jgi:hypothetical protein
VQWKQTKFFLGLLPSNYFVFLPADYLLPGNLLFFFLRVQTVMSSSSSVQSVSMNAKEASASLPATSASTSTPRVKPLLRVIDGILYTKYPDGRMTQAFAKHGGGVIALSLVSPPSSSTSMPATEEKVEPRALPLYEPRTLIFYPQPEMKNGIGEWLTRADLLPQNWHRAIVIDRGSSSSPLSLVFGSATPGNGEQTMTTKPLSEWIDESGWIKIHYEYKPNERSAGDVLCDWLKSDPEVCGPASFIHDAVKDTYTIAY